MKQFTEHQVLMHDQKRDSTKMHQKFSNKIDTNIFSSYTFSIPLLQTIRKNFFLLFASGLYIFKGCIQHTVTAHNSKYYKLSISKFHNCVLQTMTLLDLCTRLSRT